MYSSDDDSNVNIIPMDSYPSDGDSNTWPGEPYAERDDTNWRRLLACNWLQHMGSLEDGADNTLDKLPEGYCLFDKPNRKNPHIRNPALFGHPSGRYFPSQNTFLEHFICMVQGKLDDCKCRLCSAMPGAKPGAKPGPKSGRPARATTSTIQLTSNDPGDAEDPDYWRMLVMKLKERGTVDEDLQHRNNIDWVLTNESLSQYFLKLVEDPAYVPRRGELVLWIWSGLEDGSLMRNPDTGLIEIYGKDNEWHGVPDWRAGVITETPTNDQINMADIIEEPKSPRGLSYSRFRVETLPDPLGSDKSYSRQYSYVPLRNIKPLNTWQLFLDRQERDNIHPSIENALTVMSSWSLVHKFHAKGRWPDVQIDCKGIFVGAELLAVRDTIRLRPHDYQHSQEKAGEPKVTDVMVIEKISFNMTGCTEDPKDEQLASHYTALISGKIFTNNADREVYGGPFKETDRIPISKEEASATFRQAGMSDYGPWYRMAKGQTCNIGPHQVIGRCYEPLAAQLMIGTHVLGYDLYSVMEGRNYSQQVDARISPGKTWFWGDYRVETLGLTQINGVECGPTASQRETDAKWQAILKVSRGETNHGVRRRAGIPSSAGRPFGAKNKSGAKSRLKTVFAGVAPMSKMVSSAIGSAPDDDDSESEKDNSDLTDENVAGEITGLVIERAIKSDSEDLEFR